MIPNSFQNFKNKFKNNIFIFIFVLRKQHLKNNTEQGLSLLDLYKSDAFGLILGWACIRVWIVGLSLEHRISILNQFLCPTANNNKKYDVPLREWLHLNIWLIELALSVSWYWSTMPTTSFIPQPPYLFSRTSLFSDSLIHDRAARYMMGSTPTLFFGFFLVLTRK